MIQHLPVFGICGYSGSGKTTLIVELIQRLHSEAFTLKLRNESERVSAQGLKVGVIKHDMHGLNIDREGKDSDRFFKAGADVLMRGPNELFLRAHRREDIGLDEALRLLCPYYDVLLLEGHKSTPLVDKVWLLKDEDEECPPEAVNIMRVLRRDEDRPGIVMDMLQTWLPEKWLSTPLYAGVLIGGEGHRMGRPKHLVTTSDGRTWVEVIVSVVEPLVRQVVLLGKGEIPKSLEHLPVLPDVEDAQASPEAPPRRAQGPLAGILSAMRWRPDVSWLFLSCDMPLITTDALRWLLANRKPGLWAIMPRRTQSEVHPPTAAPEVYQAKGMATKGVEPLPGWYDFRVLRLLETCRGPAGLAGHKKVATPLIPAELAAAWTNVNTVSELDAVMPFMDNI